MTAPTTQSWDGPFGCDGCEAGESGTHIHCDGPTDGSRVLYQRQGESEIRKGVVRTHWHYQGCMLNLEDDGRQSLCPDMGDRVWHAASEF